MEAYDPIFPEKPILEYASFGQRLAASIIDSLIVGACTWVVTHFLITDWLLQLIFNFTAGWLYSAIMESGANQATVGKRALGLAVTNESGERVTFGQATGRHFGKFLSSIPLLLGYFWMLWDEKQQTWHDKLSGCFVVKQTQQRF